MFGFNKQNPRIEAQIRELSAEIKENRADIELIAAKIQTLEGKIRQRGRRSDISDDDEELRRDIDQVKAWFNINGQKN